MGHRGQKMDYEHILKEMQDIFSLNSSTFLNELTLAFNL